MAGKSFSVYVEIGGRVGASLTGAISSVESKLKSLGAHYKNQASAAREAAKGILDSYKGVAALAAGSGLVFSTKHAMADGAELAHELSTLGALLGKNSAGQVADGLREANEAIGEMPTATLTNGIKILKETTGAYGDFHHAVENLKFNSKLGDVLKNTIGTEDPAHEMGSLIKALEIRGSASNPEKYRREAEKLAQAMVFFGGRLKADDIYLFASNAQVGISQLNERFLTRIAPSLIQEIGGDKVGTGLTAFRKIIGGRKITDKKQAQAWKDLGLLNEKDIIKNKQGDVTGWKDGAIMGTKLAYEDPMEFLQKTVIPRLRDRQHVDVNDPLKLSAALNGLFKNDRANTFVSAVASAVNNARLKKDEGLINQIMSLDKIYDDSILNDPKMAEFAIKSAMTNIGAALTVPLQKPFAKIMIEIARAVNRLSAALVAHPEAAKIVAGLGTALSVLAAVRLANFVFGVSGLVRALAMLAIGTPLTLAGRLIGVARGIVALSAASALSAARGLRAVAMGLWALAAFPFSLPSRLRSVAAGIAMLQAAGGTRLVLSTMASGLGRLGLAALAFPVAALRMIGVGMWALVANPVGIVIAGIVAGLTALGVWVANNWGGIKAFFGGFGEAFMKGLGPGASGAVSTLVGWLKSAWEWASKLLGPIDESGKKWQAWGEAAGKGAAAVVNALSALPAEIGKLAQEGWDALVNFDWAAAGHAIVAKVGSGLSGIGSYIAGKLGFGGDAPAAPGAPPSAAATSTAPMPPARAPGLAGRRAMGGPVAKGLPYLVGERGPEIFVPAGHGHVETNGVFSSLAQDRAATTVGAAAVSGASLKVDVDASSIQAAGETAAKSGGVIHASLDTVTKPLVDTTSIDEATEKAQKLQAILATVGSSPINIDYEGAPGAAGAAASAGGAAGAAGGSAGGGGPLNLGGGDAKGEEADFIRARAKALGIDPRVAVAVAKSEGLGTAWGSGMDHGTSFGAFQLHVGGGLGDIYKAQGGKLDPAHWREMDEFALKYAAKNGWGPWHGAARIGVRGFAGIGGRAATGDLRGADATGGGTSRLGMGLRTASEECVALAKAAVGASGSVTSWRRGVNAMAGTLKPGAPVSTFLDRQGRTSDRYAGGGTGTRGAHLDHAGVFQSYIRDAAGKIVGMRIAEQYKGSHGVHSKAYYAGKGWGEGNASNYHAINEADGTPLGGKRNPMAQAATKVAGARAAGGPVNRGLSYLVGEKGPEIFTPGATGQISTNAALDRLTSIGSASFADMPVAEFGRQVVDGTGEPVAPWPEAIRKARAESSPSSEKGSRRGGDFHAGVHHWHIQGGDPRAIRGQVESIFDDLIRKFEDDQRGSLSD